MKKRLVKMYRSDGAMIPLLRDRVANAGQAVVKRDNGSVFMHQSCSGSLDCIQSV
jgi:hypothetical protein